MDLDIVQQIQARNIAPNTTKKSVLFILKNSIEHISKTLITPARTKQNPSNKKSVDVSSSPPVVGVTGVQFITASRLR